MHRILTIIILFSSILFASCESGEVPSYIAVNEVRVETTSPEQGSASHNITDCWVSVNGKLIGVFEAPFQVPVLETGKVNIMMMPGIYRNSSHTDRKVYPMLDYYYVDTILTAGEVLTLNPVFKYKNDPSIKYAFVEDFDGTGHGFEANDRISISSDGLEGNCMHIVLNDDKTAFETKTNDVFPISKTGNSESYLEVDFKCNGSFVFGLFSRENSGGIVMDVRSDWNFVFRSTNGEWRKVYIFLNSPVYEANGSEFRLYFAGTRPEDSTSEQTEIFIDNIKLIYW